MIKFDHSPTLTVSLTRTQQQPQVGLVRGVPERRQGRRRHPRPLPHRAGLWAHRLLLPTAQVRMSRRVAAGQGANNKQNTARPGPVIFQSNQRRRQPQHTQLHAAAGRQAGPPARQRGPGRLARAPARRRRGTSRDTFRQARETIKQSTT